MDYGAGSYRRFLEGDDNGIVEIIKEYRDGLILFLNSFVRNIFVAEDLAEKVFVRLVVNKPKFGGKSAFKTWLYAVGRNIAVDHIRKESKLSGPSFDDGLEHIISAEETLEKTYFRQESKIELHRVLAKINKDYRYVLYLKYFEDFDNRDISSILKKSTRQVENLVYRAKQALKTELIKEGFEYEDL